ncbi:MAG TPA: hypothetical protein VGC90_04550, partial [Candidatus Limnocylindrales bacterium]
MTDSGIWVARARAIANAIAYLAVWLVAIELIALGAAGLVAAIDHQPGTAARAELTWAGDQAIEPALNAATANLVSLGSDVDRLGVLGRGALAALASSQWDDLDSAVNDGGVLVLQIRAETDRLRTAVLA